MYSLAFSTAARKGSRGGGGHLELAGRGHQAGRPVQAVHHLGQLGPAPLGAVGQGHQNQAAVQVVEDREAGREAKPGHGERVGGHRGQTLHQAHRLVAHVAHQGAHKGQRGQALHGESVAKFLGRPEELAIRPILPATAVLHHGLAALQAQGADGLPGHDGVAAHAVHPLAALEQEGGLLPLAQLHVGGHRGVGVGQKLLGVGLQASHFIPSRQKKNPPSL